MTNHLSILSADSPSEAPTYREPEYRAASLAATQIVGRGTVSGAPTVDFIFIDIVTGQKYVAMLTGTLVESIAAAVLGMKATHRRPKLREPLTMSLTTDPNHPAIQRGPLDGETEPREQNKVYLVLPPEDLRKGYVKPLRQSYKHSTCSGETRMGYELSATYARDPWFYGLTYCVHCRVHRPLTEFRWLPDGESMAPADWPAAEHYRIAELRKAFASSEGER